jgi:hypothetical protein
MLNKNFNFKEMMDSLKINEAANASALRNLLIGLDIDKSVADKYSDLLVKDSKKLSGKKLKDRVKSRISNLIDDDKKIDKITNMIMDEI